MSDSNCMKTALEFVECINRQDLDGLAELMSEDHVFVDREEGIAQGRKTMRDGWSRYFAAYPAYKAHVSRVVALDPIVILVGRTTGSQVPPEIEAHETVIWTARVEDGLVAEWRILYADIEKVRGFLTRAVP